MEKQENQTDAKGTPKQGTPNHYEDITKRYTLDPERERKRAWLNRYRESFAEQRRMMEQLEEARARSTSICVSLNPAKAAPTNAHSDRVADSVQRITALEKKLRAEQCRGQDIATEIINVLYDQPQLTLNQIRVLVCQYIDGMNCAQTADKVGLSPESIPNYRRAALTALTIPEDYSDED